MQYEVSILRDRNRLRIENGNIAKGEKIPLHFFDPETDLNVSIRMEGTFPHACVRLPLLTPKHFFHLA